MVTNLAYFYETSQKTRGGKWVWVKDSNGEERKNVLLGGTILNPKKGFDHLYAAQLVQYTPSVGMLIFRSFGVKTATAAATDTTIYLNGDGYGDAPEVGMLIMKAPSAATGKGQSALVTNVVYDEANEQFAVTLSVALGALAAGDILVEAAGEEASATASVLVPKPNTFIEADRDLMPTEGYGLSGTANYSLSTVYDKQAWIQRMQPLPQYVLDMNRSYIDGIFWI
jgi:hypothetical protein